MIELWLGVVIGAGVMALVQNRAGIVSIVVLRKGERRRDAHGRFMKEQRL